MNSTLFTQRSIAGNSQIQQWGVNLGIDDTIPMAGQAIGIFSIDFQLLIVTQINGIPRFTFWDPSLSRVDSDGDSIIDNMDNCSAIANVSQRDSNSDGYGNKCDADLSNDGIVNFADLALLKSSFFSDDKHADLDGNGVVNFGDLSILKSFFLQPPGPSAVAPALQ